jgi:hypothetical protein
MTLTHRVPNPNTAWIEHPTGWLGYSAVLVLFRLVLMYVPFLSSESAWTATNLVHNLVPPAPTRARTCNNHSVRVCVCGY